jgi:hypothetical protein
MSYTDLIPKKIPVNLFKVYNPFFNFVYSFHNKSKEKIWKTPIVSKYVESIFAQHFDPNGLHRKEHRLIREHFKDIKSIEKNSDIDTSFSVISYNDGGNDKITPLTIKEIKNLSSNTIILIQEAIKEGNVIDEKDRAADGKIKIDGTDFEITVSQSYSKHGCMVLYTNYWNKVREPVNQIGEPEEYKIIEPVKPFYVDKLLWQRSSYWNFLQKDNIYIAVISIHLKIPHSGSSLIKYFKMLQYLRIEAKILKEKGYHVFIGGDLQDIQWITKNKDKIAKDARKKLILERERNIELDDELNIGIEDIEIIKPYQSEANDDYPILKSHFYKIKITKHTEEFFYIISLDFYYIKETVNGEDFTEKEKQDIENFLEGKKNYFNEKNRKEGDDDDSGSDVETDDNKSENDDIKDVKDDVEDIEENQFKNLNELISKSIADDDINKIVKEMIKDDWTVNRIYNLKNFFAPVLYTVQTEEEENDNIDKGDDKGNEKFFKKIKEITKGEILDLKRRKYDFIFTSSNILCNRKNITDGEKISKSYDKNHIYVEILKEQGDEECILNNVLVNTTLTNTCDEKKLAKEKKGSGNLKRDSDFQENKQTYMIKLKEITNLIPEKNRYMIDYPFQFEDRQFILKIIKSKEGVIETSVSFLETSKVKSEIEEEFTKEYLDRLQVKVNSIIKEIKPKFEINDYLPKKKTYFTSDDIDILCIPTGHPTGHPTFINSKNDGGPVKLRVAKLRVAKGPPDNGGKGFSRDYQVSRGHIPVAKSPQELDLEKRGQKQPELDWEKRGQKQPKWKIYVNKNSGNGNYYLTIGSLHMYFGKVKNLLDNLNVKKKKITSTGIEVSLPVSIENLDMFIEQLNVKAKDKNFVFEKSKKSSEGEVELDSESEGGLFNSTQRVVDSIIRVPVMKL